MVEGSGRGGGGGGWRPPNALVTRESPFLCCLFAFCWHLGDAVPTGFAQQRARLKSLVLLPAFPVWRPTDQPSPALSHGSLLLLPAPPLFWQTAKLLGLEIFVCPICTAPCDVHSLPSPQGHNDQHKIHALQQTGVPRTLFRGVIFCVRQ